MAELAPVMSRHLVEDLGIFVTHSSKTHPCPRSLHSALVGATLNRRRDATVRGRPHKGAVQVTVTLEAHDTRMTELLDGSVEQQLIAVADAVQIVDELSKELSSISDFADECIASAKTAQSSGDTIRAAELLLRGLESAGSKVALQADALEQLKRLLLSIGG